MLQGNPVEKMFWGRLPLVKASAQYYFRKGSMVQDLVHELKYKGNKEIGIYLGQLMGNSFTLVNYLANVDALIPLPLHPVKQRKRGYNQATTLCEGLAKTTGIPIYEGVARRKKHTDTQTKKNRLERWENMKDNFELVNKAAIEGKHVLLVDDVVTTGATLEACGQALMKAQNLQLSIACLCISRD
jgi:ComF family protein